MVERGPAGQGDLPIEEVRQSRDLTSSSTTMADGFTAEPRGLAGWLRDLDSRLFEPPHTFQEVLTLVVTRMSASWPNDQPASSTDATI